MKRICGWMVAVAVAGWHVERMQVERGGEAGQ